MKRDEESWEEIDGKNYESRWENESRQIKKTLRHDIRKEESMIRDEKSRSEMINVVKIIRWDWATSQVKETKKDNIMRDKWDTIWEKYSRSWETRWEENERWDETRATEGAKAEQMERSKVETVSLICC